LKVSEYVPGKKMVWEGGMPLGLFKGERTYTLTNRTDGSVEFSMREVYSGLMAPLITRSIPDLQPSFDEFAEALKKQEESGKKKTTIQIITKNHRKELKEESKKKRERKSKRENG